jgi:hypothetical protein
MKKLQKLAKALNQIGLSEESDLINKTAREYVNRVLQDKVSGKFYDAVKGTENELWAWRRNTEDFLLKHFSKKYPDLKYGILNSSVRACVNDWTSGYAESIGVDDSNIPPWLLQFLEEKMFPVIKESFVEAIDELPSDSETKSELRNWLSQTTLKQLGAPSVGELLDGGLELWVSSIRNLVHEIHHNILNHSAWKKFSQYGNSSDSYNLLDAMEEGFATSIQGLNDYQNEEEIYGELGNAMAEFLLPIVQRILRQDYEYDVGKILSTNWNKIYDHINEIDIERIGIKLPEDKKEFLTKVFNTVKEDNDLSKVVDWSQFIDMMREAIIKVWSEKRSDSGEYRWDFLTGDDEELLTNLMKKLDDKANVVQQLWDEQREESLRIALSITSNCIEEEIKVQLENEEAGEEGEYGEEGW